MIWNYPVFFSICTRIIGKFHAKPHGTPCQKSWYTEKTMGGRFSQPVRLVLALLLAMASWMPVSGSAQAAVSCARATMSHPSSACSPSKLMSCCRSMHGCCCRCMMMRHIIRQSETNPFKAVRPSVILAHCPCRVTLRTAVVRDMLAARRDRWLLAASLPLAPPMALPDSCAPQPAPLPIRVTISPALSARAKSCLHGLRAPPSA
jgi:hypothetical protein